MLGGYNGVGSSNGFWNTKILPNAKTTTNLQPKASENITLSILNKAINIYGRSSILTFYSIAAS